MAKGHWQVIAYTISQGTNNNFLAKKLEAIASLKQKLFLVQQFILKIWTHQFAYLKLSNYFACLSFAVSLTILKIPMMSVINWTNCFQP